MSYTRPLNMGLENPEPQDEHTRRSMQDACVLIGSSIGGI